MKICITSQGGNLDSEIDPRFGRALYFIIVDTDNMESEVIQNPFIRAGGGVGIQAAQFVVNKGVETVITGNTGPNAFQVLKAAGLSIISEASGSVKNAIEKYKNENPT